MPEEIKTCRGQTWDKEHNEYKPCDRPLYDDKHCICHSEDPDKDVDLFNVEVQKQLDRTDYHDFAGFVFPKGYVFENIEFPHDVYFKGAKFCSEAAFWQAVFNKEAYFDSAKFGGDADFQLAKFCGEANFRSAKFGGVANFSNAEFGGKANFSDAEFGGKADFMSAEFGGTADFMSAEFGDAANFLWAKFAGEAGFVCATFGGVAVFRAAKFSGEADFRHAEFGGKADFYYTEFGCVADFRNAEFGGNVEFRSSEFIKAVDFSEIKLSKGATIKFDGEENEEDEPVFQDVALFRNIEFGKDAKIVFRKIDLSQCEFLETDLTRVEFIDVIWAKTRWLWNKVKGRNAVYDEIKNGKKGEYDYRLIAQLYRRLQINYIDNCHYCEAGDFHIGEQEMVRKGKGKVWRLFCTNMIYKVVSNYGESFRLPLLWLVLVLLLFPAIFMYSGIDLASPVQQEAKIEYKVNYEWTANPLDCLLFTTDYWDAFTANLSFISFSRGQVTKRLHSQYQVLVVYAESILVIVLISFFVLALRRPYKRKT